MRLRKMCKNKLAFTLVELVIAIAVMAILAGAVAGAVVGVRASAQKSAVTSPASSLKTSLGAWASADMKPTSTWAELKAYLEKDFPDAEVASNKGSAAAPASKKVAINFNAPTTLPSKTSSVAFYVCTDKYSITITYNFKDGKLVSETDPTAL